MATDPNTDATDPRAALVDVIRRAGFDPAEFDVRDDASGGYIDWEGQPVRALTVRRKGSDFRAVYAVAACSPWLYAAFADLTRGSFGALHANAGR